MDNSLIYQEVWFRPLENEYRFFQLRIIIKVFHGIFSVRPRPILYSVLLLFCQITIKKLDQNHLPHAVAAATTAAHWIDTYINMLYINSRSVDMVLGLNTINITWENRQMRDELYNEMFFCLTKWNDKTIFFHRFFLSISIAVLFYWTIFFRRCYCYIYRHHHQHWLYSKIIKCDYLMLNRSSVSLTLAHNCVCANACVFLASNLFCDCSFELTLYTINDE